MNVCVEYLYRDAANYKSWGEVVFGNECDLDISKIEDRIRAALIDGEFFVAEEVGVPVLYFESHDDELDHQWHEFSAITPSNDPVSDAENRDIVEFVDLLSAGRKELDVTVLAISSTLSVADRQPHLPA